MTEETCTQDEADQAIFMLVSAWPMAEWPENLEAIWSAYLGGQHPADVEVAVRRAILECDRAPSVAQFGRIVAAGRRQRHDQARGDQVRRALGQPVATRESAAEHIARCRAILDQTRSR